MEEKEVTIRYKEFNSLDELNSNQELLIKKATIACSNAYSPYSHFQVGAVVKCSDGRIVTGNNQENAAYPSGICAERVALFSAVSQFPEAIITHLAITIKTKDGNTHQPVSPCGACRQVIAEYEHRQGKKIEIIFSSETGKGIIVDGIDSLLPFAFNSDFLP